MPELKETDVEKAKGSAGRYEGYYESRRGVYKSNGLAALTELDAAIEKARGMLPKGGSSAVLRRKIVDARKKSIDRADRVRRSNNPYKDFRAASPRLFPKRRK